jgi:RimJ/RimL family protein N-acetyltransferase
MLEKNEFGQIVGEAVKEWTPRQIPSKQKMQGQYCTLEKLDIDKHADKLFEVFQHHDDEGAWTYLSVGPFQKAEEFKAWLVKASLNDEIVFYVILEEETDLPIGLAGYLSINIQHGSIEVGCLHYSNLLKKTPAATEAMFLMMQYAFDELGYRRYQWKCNSLNIASCAAAGRLGFTFEGIFRQCSIVKGYNRDTAWFSIIDSEWTALKAKFEKWLSPDNFDEAGQQKVKLQEII